MQVIYRMCNIPSKFNPPPIHADNKFKLNELCLKSFVNAFKMTMPRIYFINDHCPEKQYKEMIHKVMGNEWEWEMEFTKIGINETYLKSLDIGKQLKDDILFLECDYFWMPNVGFEFECALNEFNFITPYDHPDKYKRPDPCYVYCTGDRHWKTIPSTTMTFAASKDDIQEFYPELIKHGYLDQAMWEDLLEDGVDLASPMPAMATHMVAEYMSPTIDWEQFYTDL